MTEFVFKKWMIEKRSISIVRMNKTSNIIHVGWLVCAGEGEQENGSKGRRIMERTPIH